MDNWSIEYDFLIAGSKIQVLKICSRKNHWQTNQINGGLSWKLQSHQERSTIPYWLNWCWWRMLKMKYIGDKFKRAVFYLFYSKSDILPDCYKWLDSLNNIYVTNITFPTLYHEPSKAWVWRFNPSFESKYMIGSYVKLEKFYFLEFSLLCWS